MKVATERPALQDVDRAVRRYRRLLVAYPRSFRDAYGEDLVQAFRDLLVLRAGSRGLWLHTVRDLTVSASRERVLDMRGSLQPRTSLAVTLFAVIVAFATIGSGTMAWVPVALGLLVVLPVGGAVQLRRAWVVRRTTGGGAARPLSMGIGAYAALAGILLAFGEESGWWIFMMASMLLIGGSLAGILWGVSALVAARRARSGGDGRRRAILAIVPGVLVLAFIIAAAYNSYRESLGPPGDHSVANASSESRELWQAAGAGDIEEVRRLSATCADPWVKFPVGNGRHNAKGWAEERMLQVPDDLDGPLEEIRDILRDTMDTWYDRCGGAS